MKIGERPICGADHVTRFLDICGSKVMRPEKATQKATTKRALKIKQQKVEK